MSKTTISRSAIISLAVITALAAGCNSGTPDARVAGGETRPQAPPLAPGDTSCPQRGNWRACSVAKRLDQAGLAPQLVSDTLRDAAFGVPGHRWALGEATLDVFVYATPEARERATAALDSAAVVRSRARLARNAGSTPAGAPAAPRESHFVRIANIAAILANARETQAERVLLAITAGQPSP